MFKTLGRKAFRSCINTAWFMASLLVLQKGTRAWTAHRCTFGSLVNPFFVVREKNGAARMVQLEVKNVSK